MAIECFLFARWKAFFGGTYFPPEDKGNGIIPWPQLLIRIHQYYRDSRNELIENANSIQKNLIAQSSFQWNQDNYNAIKLLDSLNGICGNHDDQFGGFGGAPKFPQANVLSFILSMRSKSTLSDSIIKRIDYILKSTLDGMSHGGIYDQIGGGFSRYSVDAYWHIPHFEKMLYDNALLISIYLRAWLINNNPLYKEIIQETIEWLDREMLLESGLYASSLDADTDGQEGAYYVWELSEIEEVLGKEDSSKFTLAYGVKRSGNFELGKSVLALQDGEYNTRKKLDDLRKKLLLHRERNRKKPSRDEKALTAWNSLLASSLIETAFYLNDKDKIIKAKLIIDQIANDMLIDNGKEFTLLSLSYKNSNKQIDGFLLDYCLYVKALLDLAGKIDWIEFGSSQKYYNLAKKCLDNIFNKFEDKNAPGFFYTTKDYSSPILRQKSWNDDAVPSGNGVLLSILSSFYAITGCEKYRLDFEKQASVNVDTSKTFASAICSSLDAMSNHDSIIVIKAPNHNSVELCREVLANKLWKQSYFISSKDESFQVCFNNNCYLIGKDVKNSFEDCIKNI